MVNGDFDPAAIVASRKDASNATDDDLGRLSLRSEYDLFVRKVEEECSDHLRKLQIEDGSEKQGQQKEEKEVDPMSSIGSKTINEGTNSSASTNQPLDDAIKVAKEDAWIHLEKILLDESDSTFFTEVMKLVPPGTNAVARAARVAQRMADILSERRMEFGGVWATLTPEQLTTLHDYMEQKYVQGRRKESGSKAETETKDTTDQEDRLTQQHTQLVAMLSGEALTSASQLELLQHIVPPLKTAVEQLHRYGKAYRGVYQFVMDPAKVTPEESEVLAIYSRTIGAHLADVHRRMDEVRKKYMAEMAAIEAEKYLSKEQLGCFEAYQEAKSRSASAFIPNDLLVAFETSAGVSRVKTVMKAIKNRETLGALPSLTDARAFWPDGHPPSSHQGHENKAVSLLP